MNAYRLAPTNLPQRRHATVFEPILMRLCKEFEVRHVKPTIVRFKPSRFRPVTCTPPMVYGINDGYPRCRMRRANQLHGHRMPTDRYQPIGDR